MSYFKIILKNFTGFQHDKIIYSLMVSVMLIKTLFILFSIIITMIDIKTGEVPRVVFITAFLFFIFLKALVLEKALVNEGIPLFESFIGFFEGLLVFLQARIVSGKKLGLADVWYSALTGLVLGPKWWYAAIGAACFTGIIYILAVKRREIPFITFMALGSTVMSFIQGWRL